jgi:hypothetical protein
MNFSTTEVFGFSEALIEFVRNSSGELSTLGINAEAWLTELEEKKKTAVTLNDEQDKMKAGMKDLTARTQKAVEGLYDISSSRLDAVIGAFGKKTELGKQAAKIRSKVKYQRKKPAVTA